MSSVEKIRSSVLLYEIVSIHSNQERGEDLGPTRKALSHAMPEYSSSRPSANLYSTP
ncbi:hypothetical protein NPIL_288441, partial [Nephila pilipes]